jgi:hypothetical protein
MCFAAMPFGRKPPPGRAEPLVDFDVLGQHFRRAVEAEGLEYVRADMELSGGFINRSMYERLIVAEYVLADMTFANANVMYEVGVRHGASARPTILLCAGSFVERLPFDFRSFRVITYDLADDGSIAPPDGSKLEGAIRDRLRAIRAEGFKTDNPIVQITEWEPHGRVEHEKTDVFLARLRFAGEMGERIAAAISDPDPARAVAELAAAETVLLQGPEVVTQLHTVLLGLFLAYRARDAYSEMAALVDRMPRELQQTMVVREQHAFALNRLAEAAEKRAAAARDAGSPDAVREQRNQATTLRTAALRSLDMMSPGAVTSETYGIRGRIYKAWADAEHMHGNADIAAARLQRAIQTYEEGFASDLRDYYPGVNAITLRVRRGTAEDLARVQELVPVVRFAVDNAPEPRNNDERYWRAATRLELAAAAKHWTDARDRLTDVLGIDGVQPWMRKTTAKTLAMLRDAYGDDGTATRELDRLMKSLTGE